MAVKDVVLGYVVGPQGKQGVEGPRGLTGEEGPKGDAGKDATINGFNVATIAAGTNITVSGAEGTITIAAPGAALKTDIFTKAELSEFAFVKDGAEAHNMIYRGKSLGTSITETQWTAISSGTFHDLFIGDYWTINSRVYRIAAFDYYLGCGYENQAPDYGEVKKHHVTIVPDIVMTSAAMNTNGKTDGAYMGSEMYTTTLPTVQKTLETDFGEHLLEHYHFLANASTAGVESGRIWTKQKLILMNEEMVYGCNIMSARANGNLLAWRHTCGMTQLPLFRLRKDMIYYRRQTCWLQDVCTAVYFAGVYGAGNATCYTASLVLGVRPAFELS